MSCSAPLTHVPGTAPQQLTVAISLSGNRGTESHPLLTFQGHSPFAWYGPELACHVHHGGITGRHFVGDGIPRPDVAKRERIIMIAPNGRSASDVDSLGAASCLEHQGVRAGINRPDQPRPGAHGR